MMRKIAVSILSTMFIGLISALIGMYVDVQELKASEITRDKHLERIEEKTDKSFKRIEEKIDKIQYYLMEN